MTQSQINYIATSKVKEIRMSGSVTFDWGNYGAWTNFTSPPKATQKKVKYNKSTKNAPNTTNGILGGNGGVKVYGTSIPVTESREISGVSRICEVRYYQRGYIKYSRPSSLKKKKQMYKETHTNAKPLQYRLQYKDKPIITESYSKYEDGLEYIFFSPIYYDGEEEKTTDGYIRHPSKCNIAFTDCRRSFESGNANNQDGRDNYGTYVLSNVRANIVTMSLEWTGLSEEQGIDLLNTLNPQKDSKGSYPYLIVQYMNPQTGRYANGTFFASERAVEKYPDGSFKSITVTLTEV